mgnify:CR=1 FL=1
MYVLCKIVYVCIRIHQFLDSGAVGVSDISVLSNYLQNGDAEENSTSVVIFGRGRSPNFCTVIIFLFKKCFAALTDWRHPLFLPGGVRYLDVPGLIASGAGPLWIAGETAATLLPASNEQGILLHEGDEPRIVAAGWVAP